MSAPPGGGIDPVDFPFTEAEVAEAVALWHPTWERHDVARKIISAKRDWAVRRAKNEPREKEAASERVTFVWGAISDDASREPWFWPALSVLSDSCAARVATAMEDHWQRRIASELSGECVAYAREAGLLPTSEEFSAAAGDAEKMRALMAELRRKMPRLPEPTDEMRRTVDERIEREKQEWHALAGEARIRLCGRRAALETILQATPKRRS